jgi:DNA-binding XRE family transcriptional regulator
MASSAHYSSSAFAGKERVLPYLRILFKLCQLLGICSLLGLQPSLLRNVEELFSSDIFS